jgi:flagellar motor protein MotB
MFGPRSIVKRGNRDEAEKPFWISFADMMTALMVLFLVVMGVALLAVTKTVSDQEMKQERHRKDIDKIMNRFEEAAKQYEGIKVDKLRYVIDFGVQAEFGFGDWRLNTKQEEAIRKFVPEILTRSNDDLGRRILKRIIVEGYTDRAGTYLTNLNLSLQRSQKVLCAMFATKGPSLLSDDQKEQVRELFFVGGYSFNAAKNTPEESRRVEMRLEFLGIDEQRAVPPPGAVEFGECVLR